MAVTYKVTKVKNPKHPETDYYGARVVKTSDYDFEDLCSDIAESTTVTRGDAMAVLAAMRPFIKKALLAGRRVVLNDLGALTIGIQGKCYPQEMMDAEDFSPSAQVKGHRVLFRPEAKLKREIAAGFQLKRVSSDVMP